MKTLVLLAALAASEAWEVADVPDAPVAAAPVVQEVAGIRAERPASAPASAVREVDEVAEAAGGYLAQPVRFEAAAPSGTALPARVEVFPCPASCAASSIAAMYAQRRILSGPGSVLRRLEAARSRGDSGEARRMEAKMDKLVTEAVMQEGGEDL